MRTTKMYDTFVLREIKNAFEFRNGILYWADGAEGGKCRHNLNDDDHAGYFNREGHYRVQLGGTEYQGARVVFAWFYGRWPRGPLKFKNGNKQDLRIQNLEEKKR